MAIRTVSAQPSLRKYHQVPKKFILRALSVNHLCIDSHQLRVIQQAALCMCWNYPGCGADQIALWSDPIKRTPVCSQTKITGSGRKIERTTIWTMVWSWSGQRSTWFEKSDHRRIRAHLSLIMNGSSAIGSDRNCIWEHLSQIINGSSAIGSDQGQYRAPYFFLNLCFSIERCWLCQEATKKQRSDQRLILSPIAVTRK